MNFFTPTTRLKYMQKTCLFFAVILTFWLTACAGAEKKWDFDPEMLDKQGLVNGVALDFEFCIPPSARSEVLGIFPEISFYPHSPGRIACSEEELLSIGNSLAPGFKEKLAQLGELSYIKRFARTYWE